MLRSEYPISLASEDTVSPFASRVSHPASSTLMRCA
jgi:hypothetical protein